MKKTSMIVCLLLSAAALSGAMKVTEKDVENKNGKFKVTTYDLPMVSGKLIYSVTKKPDGTTSNTSFGATFGEHGRNGGWDRWLFFRFYEKNKYQNLLSRIPAKVTYAPYAGGIIAEFEWALPDSGKLKLRFLHKKDMPDWVFAKLEFLNLDMTKYDFVFNAMPGTPWLKKGGERHLASSSKDYLLRGIVPDILPEGNAFAFYNRADLEEFGNLLVYESDKIQKAGFHAAKGVYLMGKPETKEILFAFGSFLNEPASKAVPRFLSEQAASVFNTLKSLDWNPKLDHTEFDALARSLEKITAADSAKKAEFSKIMEEYKNARQKEDAVRCAELLEQLRKLNSQIGAKKLSEFQ